MFQRYSKRDRVFRLPPRKVLVFAVGLLLVLGSAVAAQAQTDNAYLGEVKLFAGNFAPRGWMFCDGQILPIAQNTALFSLLGTTFGGDGRTTFGLPDLRGRAPVHVGGGSAGPGLSSYRWGEKSGADTRTLSVANLPPHSHNLRASQEKAATRIPDGKVLAESWPHPIYVQPQGQGTLTSTGSPTTNAGSGQAIENRQPFLGVRYIIAVTGTYPSRN